MAFNWNKKTFKNVVGIKAKATNGSPTQDSEITALKEYVKKECDNMGWGCDIDELESYIDEQKTKSLQGVE